MRNHVLPAVLALAASAASAQNIQPPFTANYSYQELGNPVGVPGNYGGVAFTVADPDALYLVGQSTQSVAAVYRVPLTRDANGRITGFAGDATRHADAPEADGGLQFGPGGVLFFTRYRKNELGQVAPGDSTMTKSVPLEPLGVLRSVGGLSFIPPGFPGAGSLMLASYNRSVFYSTTIVPDGNGTYDVPAVAAGPTIHGGPEGFFYIPPDSPHFTNFEHVLVAHWGLGEILAYRVDAAGYPELASRQVFMDDIMGCQGAGLDPTSGDVVISTYGSNRLLVVRGFGRACGRILHYGQGTPGSGKASPALTSRGCFARNETVSFEISDGLGGAPGVLIVGLRQQQVPVLGVDLLVEPLFYVPHLLGGSAGAPGAGSYTHPFSIPDWTDLLGTDFFFQSIYADPGGPLGLTATAGIQLNVR